MKRLQRIWGRTTGSERFVGAVALAGVLSTCLFAAIGLSMRPADISNPDVGFEAPTEEPEAEEGETTNKPDDRRIDWNIYGYDRERTKFLGATKIRPPFRKLWKYDQDELIEFAPVLAGKRMYFIDNDGVYVALNIDTGRVVWKKRLTKLNASSPALVKGVLYSVALNPGQALAVRARDGKVIWRKELPSRAESSPVVVRNRMYFGSESGSFFALRAKDGKTVWETELAGAVKAAPAFADNRLYVGDYAGKMYALRSSDGGIEWQQQDLGVGFGRTGRFYSTPAVAFGRVYVGNVDGRVYSFDMGSGEVAWTFSAGDFVYSGIAAADTDGTRPAVYFGSHDRNAYAVDAETGEEIWRGNPGGQVSGPATVIGDVAYLSTFSGNSTVGLNIRNGRRVFKFDEGEYGPAVSDGERLFVVGGSSILALKPVKVEEDYKPKPNTKGIVPPAELRMIRRAQERQADRREQRGRLEKGKQDGGSDREERGAGKPKGKRNRSAGSGSGKSK